MLLEKIRNGFEVKEKNGKENLKIKEIKSCKNLFLENLPKFLIFIWVKSTFETLFEFDLVLKIK